MLLCNNIIHKDDMRKLLCLRLKPHLVPKLRGLAYYTRRSMSDIIEESLELLIAKLEKNNVVIEEYHGKMHPGRIVKEPNEVE